MTIVLSMMLVCNWFQTPGMQTLMVNIRIHFNVIHRVEY